MGETADIAFTTETAAAAFAAETADVFFEVETASFTVGPPSSVPFLFVLEDLVLGGNFGFSFADGGFLAAPTATVNDASTLTLQSPDLTFWDVTLTSGFLNMATGAGPADANPQGSSPDGTTYELSANDGGWLDVTAI